MDDVHSYERGFLDYEVVRHLAAQVPWPYPENGVSEFIRHNILPDQGEERWVWGIFLKPNLQDLIGVVDLYKDGKPENRGFWLARRYWGRGIMAEAVTVVNDFAFAQAGFERLIFSNALGNSASRRIKEKTGSTFLGTEPGHFVDPQYTHRELWELTKENWERFRSSPLETR